MKQEKTIRLFLKGFWHGFKRASFSIATIFNVLLLTFVYFIGVGFVWLYSKFVGKKFSILNGNWGWIDYKDDKKYYRQF